MQPLNMLIVDPYFDDRGGGNVTTQLTIMRLIDRSRFRITIVVHCESEVLSALREKGDITCIVASPPKRLQRRYGGHAILEGLLGRVITTVSLLRYNFQLAQIIRQQKINLIYCNSLRAYLLVGLAAKLTRRPVHLFIKGELGNPFLDRLALRGATRIAFKGSANKTEKYPRLIRSIDEKIDIVPSGVELELIDAAKGKDHSKIRDEIQTHPGRISIAYIGLIYPAKGVHYLIEALARVVQRNKGFQLYLIGDYRTDSRESYGRRLETMIDSSGLKEHVVFLGWRSDALEVVSLMDIVVHPSLSEGFPNVVLEAMALGKPVVATKVGALGADDVIADEKEAFLVRPHDSKVIANRISLLIEDDRARERMGAAARARVEKDYTAETITRKLESIWASLAN